MINKVLKDKADDNSCGNGCDNDNDNNTNTNSMPILKNDPELSSIKYRIGTFSSFKKNMLDSISKQVYLKNLNTRSDKDFSIALFDAWANVLDVLLFTRKE